LTARTRRFRRRYPCYFTRAALPAGAPAHQRELIWASKVRRCNATATLDSGRVLNLGTNCKVKVKNGVGTGSTFKEMYDLFPKGTVRCINGSSVQHLCRAQQQTRHGIYYTEFDDGNASDGTRALIVANVTVARCLARDVVVQKNWRRSWSICDPKFPLGHVRGEFTP